MSVDCSMLAVSPQRYEALRADPRAVTDEVILRRGLGHLAGMSYFKRDLSEAEVFAQMRAGRHWRDEPGMRELYAREDALVDAALARGDREHPYSLGSSWQYLHGIMTDGEDPAPLERFLHGAPRLGEDVGYGPAGLHDPAAVAAVAAYLDLWSPERFVAVAEARRSPAYKALAADSPPGMSIAESDAQLFLRFKIYIQGAAAAHAGMLIWMS
jgi:Domain of unknown function (DUF1877)